MKLEALADSIAEYNGFSDPLSELYKLRNPGGLRGYLTKQAVNKEGLRKFRSFIDGYRALLYDLEKKCSGQSSSGLKGTSTLLDLLYFYNIPDETARYIIKYLRKATGNPEIRADVPLSFFLEG